MFAGSRQFLIPGDTQAPPLGALLHYPSARPAVPTRFGPYELERLHRGAAKTSRKQSRRYGRDSSQPAAPAAAADGRAAGRCHAQRRHRAGAGDRDRTFDGWLCSALAPACGFFLAPHALQAVTAPILALTGVPDRSQVTIQTVPNAGHFSFLSPFPRAMHHPQFAPAQDPSGFDRERFHQRLPVTVLQWIRERRGEQSVRAAGVAGL